jgi:hypothetical protein
VIAKETKSKWENQIINGKNIQNLHAQLINEQGTRIYLSKEELQEYQVGYYATMILEMAVYVECGRI